MSRCAFAGSSAAERGTTVAFQGLKVGHTTPRPFEGRVRELVERHPTLTAIADALPAARSALHREFQGFERRVRSLARRDDRARLLMSASGVGVLVSLTYASALDDPGRFRRSRQVGAHFGLTPKRYQSGEMDVSGRISKIGDRKAGLLRVRTVLYEAAHIILTRPVKAGALKSWTQGRVGASGGSCRARTRPRSRLLASLPRHRSHQPALPPASHAGRRHVVRRRQSGNGQRVDDEEIQRFGRHIIRPGVRSRRRHEGSGQAEKLLSDVKR